MSKGRTIEGDVRAIGRGGEAIVETELGIVLVPGALPGERIELEVTGPKRGVSRGRLTRTIAPSNARVEPPCREAARCGGCPLMMAAPDLQREVKLGFLRDACRGAPGGDEVEARWVTSPRVFGYRRRARLAWHGSTLGYRLHRSRRVIDVEACMVLASPLEAAWQAVRSSLAASLRGDGEIELQLTGSDRTVVRLIAADDQAPELFTACAELAGHPVVAGVGLRTNESGADATWGETEVTIGVGDPVLRAPADSFSQANDGINQLLIREVVELAEPRGLRVLELHSGVGNFTTALAAQQPSSLVAVERDPRAVEACRANLARRGLSARVVAGDANEPPKGRYDVVVLDPPRRGARRLFERSAILPGPKRVVYVSCDTATLSRDLELATKTGYRIDRIVGFDMFPQTAHLESVVRLVRG